MKVAAFGFSTIDAYEDLGLHYATGNGIDCIIQLARRGIATSAVTVVGDDEYGREMIGTLNSFSINTDHVQIRSGSTSIFKMGLKNGNDRVHLENIPGVMADYTPTREDILYVKKHEYVHMDLTGHVLYLMPELKASGCKIIMDYSVQKNEQTLTATLPFVDYAFFSYGKKDSFVRDFLIYTKGLGPRSVIATFGPEGSMAYDGNSFYSHGIMDVPVINTVGAGDAFIAGFMYGVMQNNGIESCMHSGTKFSAEVIQKFNPY